MIAAPLTEYLKDEIPDGNGKDENWLNSEAKKAFFELKEKLMSPPVIYFPDWNKQFYVMVDASKKAIGGVLMQKDDEGVFRVIAYYSKKLNKFEQKYPARELKHWQ